MWLTATEVFFGTSIIFLEPIQILNESGQPISFRYYTPENLELITPKQFLGTVTVFSVLLSVNLSKN